MLSFLLIAALVLMFLPACLSVIFASSHPAAMVWNFFWYALMGYMAAVAFESPVGFGLGFGFMFAYFSKVLATPGRRRNGMFFESRSFWMNRPFNQQAPKIDPTEFETSRQTDKSDDVIEAEFTREGDAK